jgi:hypothetical protein
MARSKKGTQALPKRRQIKSGGPGFIGAKGSSKTSVAGARTGGKRITKRR